MATLDALADELKRVVAAKSVKTSPDVRVLRKRTLAFRAANEEIDDPRWPKLEQFLASTELPQDVLDRLKPQMAALLARTEPNVPMLLRGPEQHKIYALARNDADDPLSARFVISARRSVDARNRPTQIDHMGMIIPAYFKLGDATDDSGRREWARLVQLGRRGVRIKAVIVRDQSTPPPFDPNYAQAIVAAQQNNIEVLAGIDCNGGNKDFDVAVAEIALWLKHYPTLQGFFFDRQATTPDKVEYFAQLFAATRRLLPHAQIISCPGSECRDDAYLTKAGADILCMWNTTALIPPPAWVAKFDPDRFAALVSGVNDPGLVPGKIEDAASKHISWVYVTSAAAGFLALPDYIEDEVDFIHRLNLTISGAAAPAAPANSRKRK